MQDFCSIATLNATMNMTSPTTFKRLLFIDMFSHGFYDHSYNQRSEQLNFHRLSRRQPEHIEKLLLDNSFEQQNKHTLMIAH
jgi:hypothetical protein